MGVDQRHNDNDIVKERERKNNVNDNVGESGINTWGDVLKEISEYKLGIIQDFMFGEANQYFGDCKVFILPAIKQIERFTYIWMNELSEEARKSILNYRLGSITDDRVREYSEYINSPVWKYISSIIKLKRDYTCERCGERSNPAHLVIHHKSYAHLGSELNYMDDVELLCTDCHMAVHGIRRSNES